MATERLRGMRWAGHATRTVVMRNAYKIVIENLKGKKPFGRPRRIWEDNIRMDAREIGNEGLERIHLE
jgi:hypothetical protein